MAAQFLTTPLGEELAVLPRTEYEALLARIAELDADEDAADVDMYDAVKAHPVVALPVEVSAAMLRGESLLRAIRTWRGFTPGEIEAKSGIGQDHLNDLETGRVKGTADTLAKLAMAYNVSSNWLSATED